jgi:hypothetical protein
MCTSRNRILLGLVLAFSTTAALQAQIVINEIVEDEQDAVTNDIDPDTREFVELYNPTPNPILIEGWKVRHFLLSSGAESVADILPTGATIPGHGYYVIGQAGVPNVDFTPVSGELWAENSVGSIFELRRPDDTLADAVGLDTFRGVELANATQPQLDQLKAGEIAGPDAQGGWWGQIESNNAIAPNVPMSLARYQDGRDRNINGYDFGMMPISPGAPNDQGFMAPGAHVIPDVDGMAVGTRLGDQYYASFVLPRVVNPTSPSAINPKAIDPSPHEGNVIVAWDETGGGNAIYSRQLVTSFSLAAYIDTAPLATSGAAIQSEATIYGIGTTDPLFGTPDGAGLLGIASSQNGSTGLGWYIQRVEDVPQATNSTVLKLYDFNDGGDGVPEDEDWIELASIDLTGIEPGWHNLGIDYDPITGMGVATHNGTEFEFTTAEGLVGTFYVGYRENLPGTGGASARPPTFDIAVLEPPVFSGDYNGDSVVDARDYLVWRNSLNMSGQDLAADGNGDGTVDEDDYLIWKDDFGTSYENEGHLAAATVPEPSTIALVGIGLAGFLYKRSKG